MYRRVVVVVGAALFSLLALIAVIITDLHDRDFPQAIGAQSRLGLNFENSRFSDAEAPATLREADERGQRSCGDRARGPGHRLFTRSAAAGTTVVISTHDPDMIEASTARHRVGGSRAVEPIDDRTTTGKGTR